MKVQAFPTSARVPVDEPEARRVARERFAESLEDGRQISVRDFGEFFTILVFKPVTDLSDPDAMLSLDLGRSVSVLDKSTGRISYWPSLAEEYVADQYAACVAAGEIEAAEWPESNR
jgi:hypothetical protein